MMQSRQPSNLIRSFSVLAGILGLFAVGSLPVRAQTSPAPSRSPSQVSPSQSSPSQTEQPANTAPSPADALSNSENQAPTELLQQLSQAGSFTTLSQAVEAAGLSNSLQGGQYTIFAPTDEAFAELPQGALEQLLRPENRGLLQQVLAYHVVPAELTSNELSTGGVDTLGGGIAVRVTPERIIVNNGSVIRSDIPTENGVVHVVNRVLMPSELRQQIISLQ